MAIKLDSNLEKVLAFMESNVEADKLVRTAATIAALAPTLWGTYVHLNDERLLCLTGESHHEQLSIATRSAVEGCAGGDSAEAMGSQSRM
jgi:hypothetical protein